jgi:hypothetical protein
MPYAAPMRRLLTPRWLDLLLVLALVSLALYVQYYDRLNQNTPLAHLWPYLTVDLFAIWLAARAIDGVISLRQRREAVVRSIRRNINYMGKVAGGLLPDAQAGRIKDLQDEFRWFELTLERQSRYLRADEKTRTATVAEKVPDMLADAQQIRSVRLEARRLAEELESSWPTQGGGPKSAQSIPAVAALMREYRAYFSDVDADAGRLTVAVNEARRRVGELALDDSTAAALNSYVTAVETASERRQSLQAAVGAYVELMRDTEIMLLGRVRE